MVITVVFLVVVVVVLSRTLGKNPYSTATPVRSHLVGKRDLENRITGTGTFKPRTTWKVIAQVSGEVKAVFVREGERVFPGTPLIRLDEASYSLALDQAENALVTTENMVLQTLVTLRAGYRSALNALGQSKRAYEKNESLYKTKAISEEIYQTSFDAYQTTQVNCRSAKEQLNLRTGLPLDAEPILSPEKDEQIIASSPEVIQAKLSVKTAADNLARSLITAAASGTVTTVTVSEGDYIPVMAQVLQIESLDDMLAEIQIDEVDISKVKVGQEVELTSDSILGRILFGRVVEVAPTVKTLGSTRVSAVKVDIRENPQDTSLSLKGGASCTARIVTSVKEAVTVIPLSGFMEESNVNYVFLMKPVESGGEREIFKLERREIKIGMSNVNFIEVVSGLAEGDRVALGNLNLLRDDIYVTLKEED